MIALWGKGKANISSINTKRWAWDGADNIRSDELSGVNLGGESIENHEAFGVLNVRDKMFTDMSNGIESGKVVGSGLNDKGQIKWLT